MMAHVISGSVVDGWEQEEWRLIVAFLASVARLMSMPDQLLYGDVFGTCSDWVPYFCGLGLPCVVVLLGVMRLTTFWTSAIGP